MLRRKSSEMEEDEVEFISKKLKSDDEVTPLAGPSRVTPSRIVANTVEPSPITVKELSAPITKKNFNAMVLESGILNGKWNKSEADIVDFIKKDSRFKLVAEEKLSGYKSQAVHSLYKGLEKSKERQNDEFAVEQRRREALWNSTASNLSHFKETYQLQPFLDYGNIDGYSIEAVHAGGTADVVLTTASTRKHPLSWSEKLLLPVFLPIEAKSAFNSSLNGKQRRNQIQGLDVSYRSTSMTPLQILVFSP
jgi:hypothetical protein